MRLLAVVSYFAFFCSGTAVARQGYTNPVRDSNGDMVRVADPFVYRQLRTTTITNWLLHAGFLEVSAREGGTPTRRPTALGRTIGLSAEERSGKRGTYTVTLYGPEAQRFILDNLDAMLSSESQPLG